MICTAYTVHSSPIDKLFTNISFEKKMTDIESILQSHCRELKKVESHQPTLPIANKSEQILICNDYPVNENHIIEEIAFVFGDNDLFMVEIRKGGMAAIEPFLSGAPFTFNHLSIFIKEMTITDHQKDITWLMTPEALHSHLFLRPIPQLAANQNLLIASNPSVKPLDLLAFGKPMDALLKQFEAQCSMIMIQPIASPWLASKPKKQSQINCFGIEYAGYTRKIEAVFGDGILQQVWILTGKGEESRIRQKLIEAYGQPSYVSEEYEAFNNWQVALRKDKPEVLMLSQTLANLFKKQFAE